MIDYFVLTKTNKKIYDEDGEPTGYELYELKLPENYPKVLNKITITHGKNTYKYIAIPKKEPQTYYIKPINVSGNVRFVEEMRVLEDSAKNAEESIDNYTFYNIDQTDENEKTETKTRADILLYLGYVQQGNKFVLGKYVSEAGITRFKPMFEHQKRIVPSKFKNKINKINQNSWILTVLYSISPWFKDEKSKNYLTAYGVGPFFKDAVNKLIEMKYVFKNNGKIYDVYTLFDLFDLSYSGFAHECFNLGSSLDDEKIKRLFEKYQINFNEKKEDFAKFYADVVNYYISSKFEELLDDPEGNKAKILRFLGLDYKT